MKNKMRFTVALLLTIFYAVPVISKSFTIEQIMSAPFPHNLVVSPAGDRVAWIFNARGRRNIWLAEAPNYLAKKLTSYDKDDGQELGGLDFSPDGSIIVFVRGAPRNRQGYHPNPTSNPHGAVQAVWAVKISGGKPWKLGDGSNPKVSPKGDLIVFERGGQLFKAPIDSVKKDTHLFKARGRNSFYVWSPDGSKLAFVSERDDHSFIGIYDLDRETITWIAPSVDKDCEPVWSPDCKSIAFIRFPGTIADPPRNFLVQTFPFAIWVANVETGEGQQVWASPDSSGGFAQSYPLHPLMWGVDNLLIFYSEHEGWMHLYSVSIKDGKTVRLTPGEYEVEDCCLSPDRKTLIFSANRDDVDRRHLWSINVTGGKAKRLTLGNGIEWQPVISAHGIDMFFLCSTAFQSAAPAVMNLKNGKPRLIAPETIPDDYPMNKLVEPEQVIFKAPDGLMIHAQLFLPKETETGDQHPAVIYIHGGPKRQMLLGWHMWEYYNKCYAFNQFLTGKGYVVLSVNFRAGIGYGRSFRTASNQGHTGASEYQDIVAAARYLHKRLEVDPKRIGLWGGSYGGYLTALGLARDSELFAAGVDLHGAHNWASFLRRLFEGRWIIYGEDMMRLAYESSPVADIRFWYSPVLFIHGDDDPEVDFIQTTDLIQRLRKEGKAHVEMLIFPDESHGFLRHDRWIQAYQTAADFFDRFLMKK